MVSQTGSIGNGAGAPPRPHAPPAGYHACKPCNLKFSSNRELVLHLNSKNHKPVKCLGGGGCIREFKVLSGMLRHLESGACISKMDRKTIDALLRKQNTGNTITTEGAGETPTPAVLPSWSSTSHIPSAGTQGHSLHVHDPRKPTEFRCCRCQEGFNSKKRLEKHACPGVPPEAYHTCEPCSLKFSGKMELGLHLSSESHKAFKSFGGGVSVGNGTGALPPGLGCTGCGMFFFSEREFFSYHRGHKGVHSPVWVNVSSCARVPVSTCQPCGVSLYQRKTLKMHKKMQSHIDLFISKGLYCVPCKTSFDSDALRHTHWLHFHDPSRPTEFRCCDCQENFHTDKLLKKHICPRAPRAGSHTCEPCNLNFSSNRELVLHLNSKNHKPVKCLGGSGCIREFKDLPGMLQHLESGSCVSKMDRKAIDALLRKHDTGNIITIEGAGDVATPAILPSWSSASHISSASTVFEEVETDSDGEDSGGVVFPPTSSPPRRNSVDSGAPTPIDLPTPIAIGSYGFPRALTPLSGGISELESRLKDPLVCPICSKKFNNPGGLAAHIASPVHAVPKYHCPKEFLEQMGMKMDRHGVERTFKTLSGLAQHIYVRACAADRDAWVKMLQFLEGKLSGLGYDEVRLLSQ